MEIPAVILRAASMAAFPGLPDGMTVEEADRRVAAPLTAAWPLIESDVRAQVAQRILAEAVPGIRTMQNVLEGEVNDDWSEPLELLLRLLVTPEAPAAPSD